ncbi:MAG: serine hydrolase [Deltaproteobacteria bacterium]|nr:serine hydrolase [Deltaproteobacteria bacterium]MBW2726421.1 serine hydrolase [Deltaproteobacteria bacterium]
MNSSNWLSPPHNRVGFIRVSELARTERISRGTGPVAELPRAERSLDSFAFEFEGGNVSLASMLEATYTDALLVLHDGSVMFEQYTGAMTAEDTHLLMSVSKSISSTLCGIFVHRGLLDPDDLVVDHVPELRETAWQSCTIQHLLDMRTGTRWNYDEDEIDIFDVSDYRTSDRRDLPADTASWIRSIDNSHPHGGAFRYISLASDVLGWVLEKVGGEKFSLLVSREVWSLIGAEHDAEIMLDASGFSIVEGGLCATLRDVGRFGQLCLQNGKIAGREVIPAEWLARLRVVDRDLIDAFADGSDFNPALPDAFYHDNWWIDDARAGVYSGLGVYGQTLLIHHPSRTVIVKLSSQPALEDERMWALQRAGLTALCNSLG